jgi:biotin carboxyl carrier protein
MKQQFWPMQGRVEGDFFGFSSSYHDGNLKVKSDGEVFDIPVKWGQNRSILVFWKNQWIELFFHQVDGKTLWSGRGVHAAVEVMSTRQSRTQGGARVQGASPEVRSQMPGKVVAVKVSEGQKVEVGQSLVVLEAMKMENEVKATAKAEVVSVHVKPGQAVESGAILITLRLAESDA